MLTIQQVNNWTVLSKLNELLYRVLDLSVVPQGDQIYTIDVNYQGTYYDSLVFHPNLTKPTMATLEAELAVMKQEHLDEINRIQDLRDRWSSISDIYGALKHVGTLYTNPALELERIIAEDDQAAMVALESAHSTLSTKEAARDIRVAKRENGRKARQACSQVLDLITGINFDKQLSKAQVDSMVATWGNVLSALQANRPNTAKALINAITPDGVLVTQEDVDMINEEFATLGF